jgi:hypothetical protein
LPLLHLNATGRRQKKGTSQKTCLQQYIFNAFGKKSRDLKPMERFISLF